MEVRQGGIHLIVACIAGVGKIRNGDLRAHVEGAILNLTDLEGEERTHYCELVWNVIDGDDSNRALGLQGVGSGFWSRPWHSRWREMQYMLIKDHIEEHAAGSADMGVLNYDGDVEATRSHLYKQFGSGAGGDIHAKDVKYGACMPEKGQSVFPKGADMSEKLRQLKSRHKLF